MRSHLLKSSHTVLAHLVGEYEPLPYTTIPGIQAEHFEFEADALYKVLEAGKNLDNLVIHIQPNRAEVEDRETLASSLRFAGVHKLARQLKSAVVPAHHVLVLINTDARTELRHLPLSALIPPSEVL